MFVAQSNAVSLASVTHLHWTFISFSNAAFAFAFCSRSDTNSALQFSSSSNTMKETTEITFSSAVLWFSVSFLLYLLLPSNVIFITNTTFWHLFGFASASHASFTYRCGHTLRWNNGSGNEYVNAKHESHFTRPSKTGSFISGSFSAYSHLWYYWKLCRFCENHENFQKILQKFWESFIEIFVTIMTTFWKFKEKFVELILQEILRIFHFKKICGKSFVKIFRYFCENYKNFMWKFWEGYAVLLKTIEKNSWIHCRLAQETSPVCGCKGFFFFLNKYNPRLPPYKILTDYFLKNKGLKMYQNLGLYYEVMLKSKNVFNQ